MQRSRAKVDAPSGRDGEHFLIGQNPKFLKTNFVRCWRRVSRPNKLACKFQCLGTSRKVEAMRKQASKQRQASTQSCSFRYLCVLTN